MPNIDRDLLAALLAAADEHPDQPLIAHLQRLTRPLTDDLIISCNRNHDQYARDRKSVV